MKRTVSCLLLLSLLFVLFSFRVGADTDFHTHVYTDWQYNSGQHYKNCTDCDEVFFVESHKGGVATCQQDGKCTVCGYAYIKASEDAHVPDTSKWVARQDMYHFHKCTLCGAHCDVEDHRWSPTYLYKDENGHAWICADCKATSAIEKHNPGPKATETTPQTCKDCGYIIEPVKSHKHELTKVPQTPATCMEEGNIEYYLCTGCNDCFTDPEGKNKIPEDTDIKVGALGHTTSDGWNNDEDYHWRFCTVCQTVLDETKMVHQEQDGKCTDCGYVMTSGETEPVATQPATEAPAPTETVPEPSQNGGDYGWVLIAVLAIVCFAAALTVTLILIKKKNKQGEQL